MLEAGGQCEGVLSPGRDGRPVSGTSPAGLQADPLTRRGVGSDRHQAHLLCPGLQPGPQWAVVGFSLVGKGSQHPSWALLAPGSGEAPGRLREEGLARSLGTVRSPAHRDPSREGPES